MLQILGRASSINVRKVLWTASEIGLAFELLPYGEADLSLQSAYFLSLNPQGLIPVVIDDGLVLRESNTICRYLANKHQASHLLPLAASARAEVELWMDWQQTELNNSWRYALNGLLRKRPDYQQPEAIAASVAAWNSSMLLLERRLEETSAYVCGEQFTLADVVLGLSLQRWYSVPMSRPEAPALARYYELLSQRPAYLKYGRNGLP